MCATCTQIYSHNVIGFCYSFMCDCMRLLLILYRITKVIFCCTADHQAVWRNQCLFSMWQSLWLPLLTSRWLVAVWPLLPVLGCRYISIVMREAVHTWFFPHTEGAQHCWWVAAHQDSSWKASLYWPCLCQWILDTHSSHALHPASDSPIACITWCHCRPTFSNSLSCCE